MYSVKMKREQKPRSGLALGGIGTGSIELRHDCTTRNWTIFNNKPLGLAAPFPFETHSMLFFIVKWRFEGEEPRMKLLQIEESHGAGSLERHEMQYIFPWLTGVDEIKYSASFPFSNFHFLSDDMPFEVKLTAWSPFIPFDEKNSSVPGAFFDFQIISKSKKKLFITLSASLRNAVAYDVPNRYYISEVCSCDNARGFMHKAGNVDESYPTNGSMGILSMNKRTKCYLGWEHPHPYYERFLQEDQFPEVNDVEGRNKIDSVTGQKMIYCDRCWSTAAIDEKINPKKSFEHTFVLSWHFPNNYAKNVNDKHGEDTPVDRIEGHYYSNFFDNSFSVGKYLCENRKFLEEETKLFHKNFYSSSVPEFVLDQINSHLNTMVTSSWFTKEGNFGIIEGLSPTDSYAGLSTVDVAMYGGVLYASLFPKLSQQVNRVYARFQRDDGAIAHSISRNFSQIAESQITTPRLDLTSQHAFMSLRDALWTADKKLLSEFYPSAKAAIEYVLLKRDKNGDGLPDMEGVMCSYDNFPMFGVSSFVAGQFIVALKVLSISADILGFKDDAEKYFLLYEKGRNIFEEKLWNGKYFRLYNDEGGANGSSDEGCLTDQLISQWAGHQLGFGSIYDPKKVRTALKNIIKMNFRPWQGLRNCQWPGEGFFHAIGKDIWVDQANTCWTGVELAFASLLLYEDMHDEALLIIKTLDKRYRKNGMYFDHQEFGGHYFRPMSAWSIINAMLGLGYKNGEYSFSPKLKSKSYRLFFAAGGAWGIFSVKPKSISINIMRGTLKAQKIKISIDKKIKKAECILNGAKTENLEFDEKFLLIDFSKLIELKELNILIQK